MKRLTCFNGSKDIPGNGKQIISNSSSSLVTLINALTFYHSISFFASKNRALVYSDLLVLDHADRNGMDNGSFSLQL